MKYQKLNRDQHFENAGPKRILALDGGGLKGILSLGFLAQIEALLRDRFDEPEFRLCHYYDLIAGTSTGAIIAAGLAKGMKVEELVHHYMTMGRDVFERDWFRKGLIRARYNKAKLAQQLKAVLGQDTTLGGDEIQTGLLIMTKRLDTGSPWPLGNNPNGQYFEASDDDNWISNKDYPLWQIVRASTAAPTFFDPESIVICDKPGLKSEVGNFVDGGVSPFNNPSLQAFMYATMKGYGVNWQPGANNLLVTSIGTGTADPNVTPAKLAIEGAVKSLLSLMDDCASLVETMMQWMSSSSTARRIDGDMGDLCHDLVSSTPLITYHRYNINLTPEVVGPLMPELSLDEISSLSAMDRADNLDALRSLGVVAARQQVCSSHFPKHFDLKA